MLVYSSSFVQLMEPIRGDVRGEVIKILALESSNSFVSFSLLHTHKGKQWQPRIRGGGGEATEAPSGGTSTGW
jgi:hypothetical protein